MSYSLIYTVPFATLDNIPCVVEIEKDGDEGTPTELTASATPSQVDIEGEEFLYTPTRFSTAKLQVVGNDYLQTLFSTEYRQYPGNIQRKLNCYNLVRFHQAGTLYKITHQRHSSGNRMYIRYVHIKFIDYTTEERLKFCILMALIAALYIHCCRTIQINLSSSCLRTPIRRHILWKRDVLADMTLSEQVSSMKMISQ